MERIGPYEIRGELGRGGMGVVYRAFREDLKREFALKVILSGADASPEAVARFQREAQAAAQLANHPGIVGVHDIGEADGKVYFAMDLVEGHSLDHVIDAGDADVRTLTGYIAQAAHAVEHAHAQGIVHRDLKPANILITPDGNALVTDFGLAKVQEADPEATRLTQTGQVLGTPAYMPPEQANGDRLDARSDVYALGATLYEALCGSPPFQGDTLHQLLYRVLKEEPTPLTTRDPRIPRALDTITRKCLEKVRARRYASAGGLAADLERWARGEAISARPPTRLERAGRWLRRHKALVVTAAVAGAVVTVAMAVVLVPRWQQARADAAAAKAAERAQTARLQRQAAAQPYLDRGREFLTRLELLRALQTYSVNRANGIALRALEQFKQALGADPECVQACVEVSRVYQAMGDRAAAREWAERAVVMDDRYVPARLMRAILALEGAALGSQGTRVGSTRALTPAQREDQQLAEADLAVVQAAGPDEETRALADAFAAYAAGEFQAAGEGFEAVAKQRVADALSVRWAATAYLHANNWRKAFGAFNLAVEMAPRDAWALWGRGYARQNSGDHAGALDDYDAALEEDPEHFAARSGRASARMESGDYAGGLADLAIALKRAPNDALLLSNRGAAKQHTGDRAGALADYTAALQHEPGFVGARWNRGSLYLEQGDWERAYADFDLLVQARPAQTKWLLSRAQAGARAGHLAQAIADATEVLRRRPQWLVALRLRAHAKQRSGDLPGAVADFEALLRQTPAGSEFHAPVTAELAEARRLLAAEQGK